MAGLSKIKTQADIDAKKKRNGIILGIFMSVLLIFSSVGYAFMNNEDDSDDVGDGQDNIGLGQEVYGDFVFNKLGTGLWSLNQDDVEFYFQYLPQETDEVNIIGDYSLSTYQNKALYFVNNKAASNEIINNLKGIFSRYQEACLVGGCDYDDVNETGNKDLPEKTCSDNLIVFDEIENETRVWQENNCVYISGNYILGADAFLYNVFGIKE